MEDVPKNIINVHKKVGETPLQVIERVRSEFPEYAKEKITYAGRLDPMAEGVLILLVGDEIQRKDEYLALEKEYTFDVVFGITTDTYDILGKASIGVQKEISQTQLEGVLVPFLGERKQTYPPYSSKTVEGKPLFTWARSGLLSQIHIPSRVVSIDLLGLISLDSISSSQLFIEIKRKINLLKSPDFRQHESIATWERVLEKPQHFQIARIRMVCSSGTYVRALVHEIGETLGTGAVTLAITRERVGTYTKVL